MALTSSNLREDALRLIGWVQEGQSSAATQGAVADRIIANQHAYLMNEEIAYWSLGDIPTRVYEDLKAYMAACISGEIPLDGSRVGYEHKELLELKLRKIVGKRSTGQPVRIDRF